RIFAPGDIQTFVSTAESILILGVALSLACQTVVSVSSPNLQVPCYQRRSITRPNAASILHEIPWSPNGGLFSERVGRIFAAKSCSGGNFVMWLVLRSWKFAAVSLLSLFLLPAVTLAQHYQQTNLVSDLPGMAPVTEDRKSTRLNSSHRTISYAVFCLKKKNIDTLL